MLSPDKEIYSVSRLNREVRAVLEGSFPLLWVEGEISNFACPASGHWYFTLKDAGAQVRCAMFRNQNRLVRNRPANGDQVLMRARVGLYEGRGDFQLIAEHMEEAGDGALRRAFEELKQKLATEGLFDELHKQPIPELPQRIGVITSPTGAAIRDVLSVLHKRFPALPVIIYPAAVQGDDAAGQISKMIKLAEQRAECDVLLLTRGGGSLEDLWAFNDEQLARTIHQCKLPIISAVGHEVDFTIADFVADYRAPTPSAAAEKLSPDQLEWQRWLDGLLGKLHQSIDLQLQQRQQQLAHFNKRLEQTHPGARTKQWVQRIDELDSRIQRAHQQHARAAATRIRHLREKLLQLSPEKLIINYRERFQGLQHNLQNNMQHTLNTKMSDLEGLSRALDAISPLATLNRGYSILQKPDNTIINKVAQARKGDILKARLSDGELMVKVEPSE